MATPNQIPTTHPTPITTTCEILLANSSGFGVFAKCTGTPPTTANNFDHGCLMIVTDTTTGTVGTYMNSGSIATPVWYPITGGGLSGANTGSSRLFLLDNGGNSTVVVTVFTVGAVSVPLVTGLTVGVRLNQTLTRQTAISVNFNGTTKSLVSHTNPAHNISTTYVAGAILNAIFTPGVAGGVWQDLAS